MSLYLGTTPIANDGSHRLTGEIGDMGFAPLGIDESLNLRRYLNGQVISQTQFKDFTRKVKSAVALFPSLATTESNWQAEKTNSKLGQCGKFVIDDVAGTIRLPCVVNAQGLVGLSLIGGIKNESLPNITGGAANTASWQNLGLRTSFYGCIEPTDTKGGYPGNGGKDANSSNGWSLDASRSSSAYQDNAPVQQEAVQYPYYIQVATGVEETLPAIREYKVNNSDYFGKSMWSDVDPNNASWLISAGQWNAKATYPDYYDWLVEQINAGIKGFKGNIGYALKSQTADIRFWTALRNPSVGCAVYGGPGIPFAGTVTAINPDGTLNFYEVSTGVTYENLVYTESENINIEGTAFGNLKFANDYDFVVNQTDQTFRLPIKTKLASGSAVAGNGMTLGLTNGTDNFGLISGANVNNLRYFMGHDVNAYGKPVGSGTGATMLTGDTWSGITTDPTKSGIETSSDGLKLYFYVGDTVQDASLINAGAVLGQLSDKISRTATSDKELVVGWGMPDWNTEVQLSGTSYTATYKCWLISLTNISNTAEAFLYINGKLVTKEYGDYAQLQIPLDVGDVVTSNTVFLLTSVYAMKGL